MCTARNLKICIIMYGISHESYQFFITNYISEVNAKSLNLDKETLNLEIQPLF